MSAKRLILVSIASLAATGCAKEPPPRTVGEFMDNPLLLEAALVRCTQNRAETRYNAECVNAREAVKLIEAREEASRRVELEAESLRKREALRRTQAAAAEARRRVAEERRRREEAEYLGQFGELPPDSQTGQGEPTGNVPLAIVPEAQDETVSDGYREPEPAPAQPAAGSNAPVAQAEPMEETVEDEESPQDLSSIRDELRRRNESDSPD